NLPGGASPGSSESSSGPGGKGLCALGDEPLRTQASTRYVADDLQAAALVLARRSVEKEGDISGARVPSKGRPSDPEPHRRLAEVYESSGDHAAAQGQREQADRLSAH